MKVLSRLLTSLLLITMPTLATAVEPSTCTKEVSTRVLSETKVPAKFQGIIDVTWSNGHCGAYKIVALHLTGTTGIIQYYSGEQGVLRTFDFKDLTDTGLFITFGNNYPEDVNHMVLSARNETEGVAKVIFKGKTNTGLARFLN